MSENKKMLIWGFIFGTAGLYILAILSLAIPFVENAASFLFGPGRFLAEKFAGTEGSNVEVLLLTLANGVIYSLIFLGAYRLMRLFK